MRVSSSEKDAPLPLRIPSSCASPVTPTRGTISAESGAVDFDVDGWREVYVMSRFPREQVTMPGPRMPSAGLLSLSRTVDALSLLFRSLQPDECALYREPRGTMDKLIKGAPVLQFRDGSENYVPDEREVLCKVPFSPAPNEFRLLLTVLNLLLSFLSNPNLYANI